MCLVSLGCDGKVVPPWFFLNLANFQPSVHFHPEYKFRPWRSSYVRKIMSQDCPHNVEFSCVFHLLQWCVFFFTKRSKKRDSPTRWFFFRGNEISVGPGFQSLPSFYIFGWLPGCVETDQHTHHSCSQRKRGLEGPGGGCGCFWAVFIEKINECFTSPSQAGETNSRGAFPGWICVELCS